MALQSASIVLASMRLRWALSLSTVRCGIESIRASTRATIPARVSITFSFGRNPLGFPQDIKRTLDWGPFVSSGSSTIASPGAGSCSCRASSGGASNHCSVSYRARISTGIALSCSGSTTPFGSVVRKKNSRCLPTFGALFVPRLPPLAPDAGEVEQLASRAGEPAEDHRLAGVAVGLAEDRRRRKAALPGLQVRLPIAARRVADVLTLALIL